MKEEVYDVIIIGSGPAGLTAAIYTTRADLKTAILAGRTWGGQLMLTSLVENFPGFPDGILGPEFMMNMRKQAQKHGAEVLDVNFNYADFIKNPFEVVTDEEKKLYTKSVIIATGAQTRWLGVPGEKEKIGRGVSSCAPCDAAFYRGKRVIVVGGGDSALEEAEVLTKFAEHVWLVHRRNTLRASAVMQKRAFENPKITFIFNTEIERIEGEQKVEKVELKSKFKGQKAKLQVKRQNKDIETSIEDLGGKLMKKGSGFATWKFTIDGVFVAVGHTPNSAVFKDIEKDEKGFIKVFDHAKTNIDGVFVAGDVHDSHYKQAITAAGFGCMAAMEVEKWLRSR